MQDLPKNKKIILFDGVCNLCDTSVKLIIKHDTKDIFRFVALQSALGQEIINYLGIDRSKTDSIILYEPNMAYFYKSKAAFEIAKDLTGVFNLVILFSVFPVKLTDLIYDYVAKNRYKWYGKKESCMMPTETLKSKFLS